MLNNQISALAAILKNKDLRSYAGDGFWNLIQAVITNDPFSGVSAVKNVNDIIFHMPTILFWDKMKRYLMGTFRNYEEQVKLARKFNDDNKEYAAFVKKQIHLINSIDDDLKVDYFSTLTRCFLLTDLQQPLFFKLSKYLISCTTEELAFVRDCPENYSSDNTAMVSSLYQNGLFMQDMKQDGSGEACYVLSDFAKALKQNCLNFDEGLSGASRFVGYDQLAPWNISEFVSNADLEEMLEDTGFSGK